MEELEEAKDRIKVLEMELEKAKTPKQESRKEDQLSMALARLDALEAKSNKPQEEEEEEDGDQCPQCGYVLTEVGDDTYYCNGCREYFEHGD